MSPFWAAPPTVTGKHVSGRRQARAVTDVVAAQGIRADGTGSSVPNIKDRDGLGKEATTRWRSDSTHKSPSTVEGRGMRRLCAHPTGLEGSGHVWRRRANVAGVFQYEGT